MDKKVKWGVITSIDAGSVGWSIYSQLPKANEELATADKVMAGKQINKRVLNVNAKIIKPQSSTDQVQISSSLMPDGEADLSFEISEKIVGINFDEGNAVKKGQLLAKVNDHQLQARLQRFVAQLKPAGNRVPRQNALLGRGAASKEAYEQIKMELVTLDAGIDLVKANIAITEPHAPFDGVIRLQQISVGSYASPTIIVAKLTKIIPLKIEFSVSERYANQVKKGTNLNFELEGKLSPFSAKVYVTESRIDQSTCTLTVRALYANSNGALFPGRYASIQLKKEEVPNATAIPSEAIVPEMGKDKVFLYKLGKAEPVGITVGTRTEAEMQVIKGLQMGGTITTPGTLQLRTGLPVTLDNIN